MKFSKILIVTQVALLLLTVIGCTRNSDLEPDLAIHVPKYSAYYGGYLGEQLFISLPVYVYVPQDSTEPFSLMEQYSGAVLVSSDKLFPVTFSERSTVSQARKIMEYEFNLSFVPDKAELIKIDKLKLTELDGTEIDYPVGDFFIDIREKPDYLESFFEGEIKADACIGSIYLVFEGINVINYTVQLTNQTSQPIDIDELICYIDGKTPDFDITSASDYDMTQDVSDRLRLFPDETRTFCFRLIEETTTPYVIMLPFLKYTILEEQHYAQLMQSWFSPYLTDKDIDLIEKSLNKQ